MPSPPPPYRLQPHPLNLAWPAAAPRSPLLLLPLPPPPPCPRARFLPTSRRLVQFSNGRVAPEGARIVYIDGAFDCFHPGHVKTLEVG